MKAMLMEKPWEIGITEREMPEVKPGYTLLKIRAAGICGSDIGAYRGHNKLVSYPRVIGHELAAEIVEICGDNPKKLKAGDKVVVDPYLHCGVCYPCSIGRTNCCDDLKCLGVHVDGGMAEYFVHPTDMLIKIPDDMDWKLAPMAEPVTIALHCIHREKLKAGEHIVIFGAGTIGVLAAMCAIHYGAEPILVDIVKERLELAQSIGVKYVIDLNTDNLLDKVREYTNGRMAECALEASGANSAIRSTIDVVCHAGRISYTGWPNTETPLPTDQFTFKELDLYGARTSAGEFEEAVDLIYNHKIPAEKILTKVVTIDEAPDAFRAVEREPSKYLKVNVMFD